MENSGFGGVRTIALSGLLASVCLLACGSDDEAPGSSGPGGTGGAAGSTGTGGSAATGGAAAAGGTGAVAGNGGTGATGGTSGAAGTGGGPPQGTPFVPEGITVEYVGQGSNEGLEIIAFTLLQEYGSLGDPAWIVAVGNRGTEIVCIVDVPADFLDSAGTTLASTPGAGALNGTMYESFGTPTPCLAPGDVGMAVVTLGLGSLDVSRVAKIEHGFIGNIDQNAIDLSGVVIESLNISSSGTRTSASGTVLNNGSSSIDDPEVAIYAVDPAGRPYGVMTDIELVTIPAGGSWDFETLPFDGEVRDTVEYVEYD